MGIRNRSHCIYTLHWVYSKIKIYLHVSLDTEKYKNVSIYDIGIRKISHYTGYRVKSKFICT